jgi:hypothetical protein
MLKVNKISSKNTGIGNITIPKQTSTNNGVPIALYGNEFNLPNIAEKFIFYLQLLLK